MKIKEYIERIIENGKSEDMEELSDMLDEAIMKVKPSTVKGAYLKNISISSTMGPGVKIDLNSFDK